MSEYQWKVKLFITKSNSGMVITKKYKSLVNKYNNHGNVVKFYENNTTAPA